MSPARSPSARSGTGSGSSADSGPEKPDFTLDTEVHRLCKLVSALTSRAVRIRRNRRTGTVQLFSASRLRSGLEIPVQSTSFWYRFAVGAAVVAGATFASIPAASADHNSGRGSDPAPSAPATAPDEPPTDPGTPPQPEPVDPPATDPVTPTQPAPPEGAPVPEPDPEPEPAPAPAVSPSKSPPPPPAPEPAAPAPEAEPAPAPVILPPPPAPLPPLPAEFIPPEQPTPEEAESAEPELAPFALPPYAWAPMYQAPEPTESDAPAAPAAGSQSPAAAAAGFPLLPGLAAVLFALLAAGMVAVGIRSRGPRGISAP